MSLLYAINCDIDPVHLSLENENILIYLEDFEVVICLNTKCRFVLIKPSGIQNHLAFIHEWPRKRAAQVEEPFLTKVILSPSQLTAFNSKNPPIPYLPVSLDVGCHACSYVCRSLQAMKNHYTYNHRDDSHDESSSNRLWRAKIQVQSYTRSGSHNWCFEVNQSRQLDSITKQSQPTTINTAAAQIRAQMRAQLIKNNSGITRAQEFIRSAKDKREINPWLERTM